MKLGLSWAMCGRIRNGHLSNGLLARGGVEYYSPLLGCWVYEEGSCKEMSMANQELIDSLQKPQNWEDALDIIFAEMKAMMVDRHKKYGPGNINATKVLGLYVRLMDKMARIGEVMAKATVEGGVEGVDYDDESFDDAWMDASNYAGPIYLMLKRGWWDLPMEPAVTQSEIFHAAYNEIASRHKAHKTEALDLPICTEPIERCVLCFGEIKGSWMPVPEGKMCADCYMEDVPLVPPIDDDSKAEPRLVEKTKRYLKPDRQCGRERNETNGCSCGRQEFPAKPAQDGEC